MFQFLQAAKLNQHLCEQMTSDPDKPSGLITPPPGEEEIVVKDEPVDGEDAQLTEVSWTHLLVMEGGQ